MEFEVAPPNKKPLLFDHANVKKTSTGHSLVYFEKAAMLHMRLNSAISGMKHHSLRHRYKYRFKV